jgi:hypothetical protein
MEVQAIFLQPFTVCSLCKRKFVDFPYVYEETNGSYPFANTLNGLNGLNRLNRLAYLCSYKNLLVQNLPVYQQPWAFVIMMENFAAADYLKPKNHIFQPSHPPIQKKN